MLKKLMYCAVVPVLIVLVSLYAVNEYCIAKLDEWYPSSGVWHLYNNKVKDQGLALQNLSIKNHHALMLGTSELNTNPNVHVLTDPTKFFPNQKVMREVDIIGYAGCDGLITAIRLGALTDVEKVPVIYNSSMTWFIGNEYYKAGIQRNISELQYYAFMDNPRVSDNIKHHISKEIAYETKSVGLFNELYFYSWINASDSITHKLLKGIFTPYFVMRKRFLILRDNLKAFKLVRKYKGKYSYQIHEIDWNHGEGFYTDQARKFSVTTKDAGNVYKWYYDNSIKKPQWDTFKNKFAKDDFVHSKEFLYHKMIMDVSRDIGLKPYTLMCSVNGYAYDYYGMGLQKRTAFYQKMENMQNDYRYPYLNTKFLEYMPYAFRDDAHFTSKGWFLINREITNYLSETSE